MVTTWIIFVVEWAIFMVLGWYLEQVLPGGNSVRRHPLFFLDCLKRKVSCQLLLLSKSASSSCKAYQVSGFGLCDGPLPP